MGGFLCHRCDGVLERDEASAADRAGHEKQSRLMSQIDPLLELLKRIDSEEVPQNDFAAALAVAIPVTRNLETHPVTETTEVKSDARPTSKLKQEVNMEVKVNFITEEGTHAAESEAKARKAEQERQNALPAWYTDSTLGRANAAADPIIAAPASSLPAGVKAEEVEDKKDGIKQQSDIEAYYASLRAEQEAKAAQESEEGTSDDEEEDDDGFEDVEIGVDGSGKGTPSSAVTNGINRNGKRPAADDITGTPASTDTSPTKKAKVEDGILTSSADPTPAGTQVTQAGDSDEDEDEEFEDAL